MLPPGYPHPQSLSNADADSLTRDQADVTAPQLRTALLQLLWSSDPLPLLPQLDLPAAWKVLLRQYVWSLEANHCNIGLLSDTELIAVVDGLVASVRSS
jgi:hypothetical protein